MEKIIKEIGLNEYKERTNGDKFDISIAKNIIKKYEPIINKLKCNKTIYILQCEDNKYYIGMTTRPVDKRINEHFNNQGSNWTKLHKCINVIGILYNCDIFDENKYTKIFMKIFGIDNVRGGSYCQIELPEFQLKALEYELNDGEIITELPDHVREQKNLGVCLPSLSRMERSLISALNGT